MNSFSRRNFFKTFIPKSKTESVIENCENEKAIFLGGLNDFPVNVETVLKLGQSSYKVLSCERGLKIRNIQNNEHYLLSLIRGQIFFQPSKKVSSSMVLSIMTGEMDNEEGGQCG